MGRVQSAAKNIAFGYIGNLTTQLLGFILRTVFISYLGDTLNGINDLYTGILSVLSLAELGVGTALNYSLYGPVARKDYEKIKSYMQLYKKAYRVIGLVIAVIGLAISPFLPYLVKQPQGVSVRDLTLYYFIFLFNTVSTYFVAYKYSLAYAEQKNYIQTNTITITKMITVTLQIAVIVTTRNFYLYLLTAAAVELIQKIFISWYLNRLYPYLKDKNVKKLSKEETGEVVTKTKALVFHKVGDVARLQTDSMIISAFINVTLVGFVGNYNMILNSVANFVNIIFNSVLSSFGNLIATESKDKQYSVFKVYRFFACWIYGFSAVGFFLLLTPFIVIWQGPEKVLAAGAVACILIDYYFKGDRIVLSNFKTAAGVFEQDKYLALIQGVVNLILSIVLVQKIGLVGIYIGTIVSGLIANITKPFIIYKVCFEKSVKTYFLDSVKYLAVLLGILVLLTGIRQFVMPQVTVLSFILMFIVICVVFNGIFLLLFGRTQEFGYLWGIIKKKLGRKDK
ncbi:MAG: oligosaccharide flippase family protein [Lachnospiraceae bacterium]|nr:oligosaccharide flippase family protein [Lachnospiraceae bacterium]